MPVICGVFPTQIHPSESPMLGLMVPIHCQWQGQDVHLVGANTVGTQETVFKTQTIRIVSHAPSLWQDILTVMSEHIFAQRQTQLMTME